MLLTSIESYFFSLFNTLSIKLCYEISCGLNKESNEGVNEGKVTNTFDIAFLMNLSSYLMIPINACCCKNLTSISEISSRIWKLSQFRYKDVKEKSSKNF